LALKISLAKRHTSHAQDIVGSSGVEKEVVQRKREEEGLGREDEVSRTNHGVYHIA
jgi:hypothetical protein